MRWRTRGLARRFRWRRRNWSARTAWKNWPKLFASRYVPSTARRNILESLTRRVYKCYNTFHAGVAELADALDLGSSAARRGGSNPLVRTSMKKTARRNALPFFASRFWTDFENKAAATIIEGESFQKMRQESMRLNTRKLLLPSAYSPARRRRRDSGSRRHRTARIPPRGAGERRNVRVPFREALFALRPDAGTS